ncbi:hypothetical protein E2C01_012913 [Portunus trituberculatus]|uniref:Uncharacterized protein n=1 Tax=Portunus trituberculatus TaxID=210409 RepID=A0A5B7DFF8_PORTR|nr:hypothetical protein [Portunus trituberculatus]
MVLPSSASSDADLLMMSSLPGMKERLRITVPTQMTRRASQSCPSVVVLSEASSGLHDSSSRSSCGRLKQPLSLLELPLSRLSSQLLTRLTRDPKVALLSLELSHFSLARSSILTTRFSFISASRSATRSFFVKGGGGGGGFGVLLVVVEASSSSVSISSGGWSSGPSSCKSIFSSFTSSFTSSLMRGSRRSRSTFPSLPGRRRVKARGGTALCMVHMMWAVHSPPPTDHVSTPELKPSHLSHSRTPSRRNSSPSRRTNLTLLPVLVMRVKSSVPRSTSSLLAGSSSSSRPKSRSRVGEGGGRKYQGRSD